MKWTSSDTRNERILAKSSTAPSRLIVCCSTTSFETSSGVGPVGLVCSTNPGVFTTVGAIEFTVIGVYPPAHSQALASRHARAAFAAHVREVRYLLQRELHRIESP